MDQRMIARSRRSKRVNHAIKQEAGPLLQWTSGSIA
jgi:hypothetical protein